MTLSSVIALLVPDEEKGTARFENNTHLVIILHNSPLPSTCVNPSNKVLHSPRDKHSWIGHWCRSYSDMTLLYSAYRVRDGFGHFETRNDHGKTASGNGRDCYFIFNVRGFGADVWKRN